MFMFIDEFGYTGPDMQKREGKVIFLKEQFGKGQKHKIKKKHIVRKIM